MLGAKVNGGQPQLVSLLNLEMLKVVSLKMFNWILMFKRKCLGLNLCRPFEPFIHAHYTLLTQIYQLFYAIN